MTKATPGPSKKSFTPAHVAAATRTSPSCPTKPSSAPTAPALTSAAALASVSPASTSSGSLTAKIPFISRIDGHATSRRPALKVNRFRADIAIRPTFGRRGSLACKTRLRDAEEKLDGQLLEQIIAI